MTSSMDAHDPSLQPIEHSIDELRAIIESYLGGISVIVYRDPDQGWDASISASPKVKALFEERLQEIVSVMHDHRLILREGDKIKSGN
jgi:hypothetical protein